ncbi:MAG: endolytic transglycosylase MltG, partial [Beijerinckiaceae bacterium]|nr:endolytic transglycosylase MltG [Beijerinckiaceae bacterium]
ALLARMQREQRRVLQDIWNRRSKETPLKNPRELVTLASIVEKETGRADERSRVAGVFVNRLNRNMKLQSDPTIIYGLVGGKATLGRGILRSEIERPTPYNTYVINGLPPGPIANPGRAAMEATANPSRTRDVFFVADGTGGHAFAETLEQHNRNVARWRQIEASRVGQGTPPATDGNAPPPAPGPPAANRTSLEAPGIVTPGTTGAVTGFAPAQGPAARPAPLAPATRTTTPAQPGTRQTPAAPQ